MRDDTSLLLPPLSLCHEKRGPHWRTIGLRFLFVFCFSIHDFITLNLFPMSPRHNYGFMLLWLLRDVLKHNIRHREITQLFTAEQWGCSCFCFACKSRSIFFHFFFHPSLLIATVSSQVLRRPNRVHSRPLSHRLRVYRTPCAHHRWSGCDFLRIAITVSPPHPHPVPPAKISQVTEEWLFLKISRTKK